MGVGSVEGLVTRKVGERLALVAGRVQGPNLYHVLSGVDIEPGDRAWVWVVVVTAKPLSQIR